MLASAVAVALTGCSGSDQGLPPGSGDVVDAEALMVPGPLGDKTLGDPEAPNVVVEYASLTCPHCRAFHTAVFPSFKEKYIDTGQVYFVFRQFSLNLLDTAAIMLANCVPQEQFFPIVELLYEQQPTWAASAEPVMALRDLVKQVGISANTFDACVANQQILDGVNWVKDRATKEFGVNSTPTFFFNGERRVGEHSLVQIDEILAG
jgi:protein-disulfide isomerase